MEYLENILASLYKGPDDATRVLLHCGVDPAGIDLSGGGRNVIGFGPSGSRSAAQNTAILERAAEEVPRAADSGTFQSIPEFEKRLNC